MPKKFVITSVSPVEEGAMLYFGVVPSRHVENSRLRGSEGFDGVLSYLLRLEPGFKSKGHNHPVDEECLMLEGDLTLGGLTLNAGDYHLVAAGLLHGNVSTVNGCMAFIRGAVPV